MSTCTVCDQNIQESSFSDSEQNKCILHCEKNEENGWYHFDNEGNKQWDDEKVELFWKTIQKKLDRQYRIVLEEGIYEKEVYHSVIFPKFQNEIEFNSNNPDNAEMGKNFYSFNEFEYPESDSMEELNTIFENLEIKFERCIFLDEANFSKYSSTEPILFDNCEFKSSLFLLNKSKDRASLINCLMNDLKAANIVFKGKVKIKECTIENADFHNTIFEDLCDFYSTTFKNVNFERTNFKDISVFTEAVFENDVNFKYTTFSKATLFRKTDFKRTVNFEDSIFKEEANFLNICAGMANRETARIIKNTFEKQNNIIEANKFYALEMWEREKELKLREQPFEWLVFKVHNLSSEHSQNWVMALSWILAVGFLYTSSSKALVYICYITFYVVTMTSIEKSLKKYPTIQKIVINIVLILLLGVLFLYIVLFTSSFTSEFLDNFVKNLNLFSIYQGSKNVTFGFLLYRMITAYLVYQFIISIRQNTRRK